MRVVHVIPSMARQSGGPAEALRRLLPSLQAIGVETTLLCTDKDLTDIDDDIRDNPDVKVVKAWTRRWTFAPTLTAVIWRALSTADVVHVHSVHTFPTTVALALSRIRKKPAVLQPHGALNVYHLRKGRLIKMLYFRFIDSFGLGGVRSALYSSSIEVQDGHAALPRIPGRWLPLGVDEGLLSTARISNSVARIVFLSRMAKKKRLDLLLTALSKITERAWQATVAGPIDRDLPYNPQALADSLGLHNRIEFVGTLDANSRTDLLRRADIFVLPSDDESFGMAAAEAMAAGCAVVTSPNVGSAIDAAASGGVLVVDRNAEVLALKLKELLEDGKARTSLGVDAREYAINNLRWSAIAERLYGYYTEAIHPDEVVR